MAVRRGITSHEQLRRRAGFTVTALARAIGVNHAYVSRIESGQIRPSQRYRRAFAETVGIPEDFVFDEVTA